MPGSRLSGLEMGDQRQGCFLRIVIGEIVNFLIVALALYIFIVKLSDDHEE